MATVSVTFDNLGEAAELERGTWPEDRPLGEHFTVRECLPELLGLLAREDLQATFFLEGLNGELYPDAVAGLRAAGHEVACHGWRHEPWHGVSDERGRLERARDALGGPIGFRPPGGRLNAKTPELRQAALDLGIDQVRWDGRLAQALDHELHGIGVAERRAPGDGMVERGAEM